MIKIGDFARLSHVSVVTLRHYDEIGLLPPAAVERHMGYRRATHLTARAAPPGECAR